MIKYSEKHSITETAIRFRVSRKTVHKWLKRYNGTLESLEYKSHRPKSSPNAHTERELKLIRRLVKKHKWHDLILAYQELIERYGYSRSYGGFKRVVSKMKDKKPKKKTVKKPKQYKRADYVGQKVQVDVKFVPSDCTVDGKNIMYI
ncbi:MAG: helix-turn-helix domain-containing protein [Lachnospirales bacterium]